MKLTYGKNEFDVEDGKFNARFEGITLKDATGMKDQKGNLMPPGMTWDFTLLDGPDKGKRTDRLTGRAPTPKSGAGKMLAGITDSVLKDGTEVDLANYVGKIYRVTIIEGRISDAPAPVRVYDGQGATNSAPSAPRPPVAPKPPGAPTAPKQINPASRWNYCTDGQTWVPATAEEFQTMVSSNKIRLEDVFVTPEGKDDVKTAKEHGFSDIPF